MSFQLILGHPTCRQMARCCLRVWKSFAEGPMKETSCPEPKHQIISKTLALWNRDIIPVHQDLEEPFGMLVFPVGYMGLKVLNLAHNSHSRTARITAKIANERWWDDERWTAVYGRPIGYPFMEEPFLLEARRTCGRLRILHQWNKLLWSSKLTKLQKSKSLYFLIILLLPKPYSNSRIQ